MIRIGVLGAAWITPRAIIAPARRRGDSDVVAVAASSLERAQAFARENAVERAIGSYAELVTDPEIDLIYNALTPSEHLRWSIAALEAGKPVLCEKPLAMNAAEACAMVAAAARTGVPLVEGFHYRFHPFFAALLAAVADPAMGPIRSVDASFAANLDRSPGSFRIDPVLGGGCLMDMGCYVVHWLRTLLPGEAVVETAQATPGPPGIDLAMRALLRFGTLPASLYCNMAAEGGDGPRALIRVTCEHGVVEAHNPMAPQRGNSLVVERRSERRERSIDGPGSFDHQLAHMIDVMTGRAAPLTGGEDSIANMALIDAIYRAAGMAPRGFATT